jgi:hypothetical protein
MKSPYLISLATASSVLAGGLTLAATENDPGSLLPEGAIRRM